MKNNKVVTALLLTMIAAVITGIYFVKNQVQMNASRQKTDRADTVETVAGTGTGTDFGLAINEKVDYKALASHGIPIIVDYGSDSCIPCKEMAPVLEKLNKEMQGKAFIKFVDVWKHPDATGNVPVRIIPTQILVNAQGAPFVPSEELAAKIEFIMYKSNETGKHVFTVHQGGITEEQMRMILAEMGVSE